MKVTNDIHYILLLLYPVRYLEQRLATYSYGFRKAK